MVCPPNPSPPTHITFAIKQNLSSKTILYFFFQFSVSELLSDEVLPWYDQAAAAPMRNTIRDILLELGDGI